MVRVSERGVVMASACQIKKKKEKKENVYQS